VFCFFPPLFLLVVFFVSFVKPSQNFPFFLITDHRFFLPPSDSEEGQALLSPFFFVRGCKFSFGWGGRPLFSRLFPLPLFFCPSEHHSALVLFFFFFFLSNSSFFFPLFPFPRGRRERRSGSFPPPPLPSPYFCWAQKRIDRFFFLLIFSPSFSFFFLFLRGSINSELFFSPLSSGPSEGRAGSFSFFLLFRVAVNRGTGPFDLVFFPFFPFSFFSSSPAVRARNFFSFFFSPSPTDGNDFFSFELSPLQ